MLTVAKAQAGEAHLQWVSYPTAKRVMDVVVSALVLVAVIPLWVVVAVAIRLDSPGPVLFVQERIGFKGKRFRCFKFRTMQVDAEARLAEMRRRGEVEGPVYKLRRDPRVTRVGRWLRRTSLDELPQLLNVLRGEMSLVGPRPCIPYELEHYQPVHWQRLSVKPGMTGVWQVYGRSVSTFDEMVQMDLRYIREQSLLLDLKLLVKT